MPKPKNTNNKKHEPYMSYRAARDLHVLIYLAVNGWIVYNELPLGKIIHFSGRILIPFIIFWTIILIAHFWFVKRIREISAERDSLLEKLKLYETETDASLRLRDYERDEQSLYEPLVEQTNLNGNTQP